MPPAPGNTPASLAGAGNAISRRRAILRGMLILGSGFAMSGLAACAAPSTGRRRLSLLSDEERNRLNEPITIRPYERKWNGPSNSAVGGSLADAIPRADWAGGNPVPRLMDRMQPINKVTLHHDGMTAFTSTSRSAGAYRVESIRKAHRGRGWGDVGYHYLIDPAGRVWEGRPLSWQGAHVRAQNEGNLGICVMGNYEKQSPNSAQLSSIERTVAQLMRQHRIRLSQIRTHREMAPTACPGRTLQSRFDSMRSSRGPLARV